MSWGPVHHINNVTRRRGKCDTFSSHVLLKKRFENNKVPCHCGCPKCQKLAFTTHDCNCSSFRRHWRYQNTRSTDTQTPLGSAMKWNIHVCTVRNLKGHKYKHLVTLPTKRSMNILRKQVEEEIRRCDCGKPGVHYARHCIPAVEPKAAESGAETVFLDATKRKHTLAGSGGGGKTRLQTRAGACSSYIGKTLTVQLRYVDTAPHMYTQPELDVQYDRLYTEVRDICTQTWNELPTSALTSDTDTPTLKELVGWDSDWDKAFRRIQLRQGLEDDGFTVDETDCVEPLSSDDEWQALQLESGLLSRADNKARFLRQEAEAKRKKQLEEEAKRRIAPHKEQAMGFADEGDSEDQDTDTRISGAGYLVNRQASLDAETKAAADKLAQDSTSRSVANAPMRGRFKMGLQTKFRSHQPLAKPRDVPLRLAQARKQDSKIQIKGVTFGHRKDHHHQFGTVPSETYDYVEEEAGAKQRRPEQPAPKHEPAVAAVALPQTAQDIGESA